MALDVVQSPGGILLTSTKRGATLQREDGRGRSYR